MAAMVHLLLENGANPNEKFEKRTCWERALLWQYENFALGSASAVMANGGTTDDARIVAESRAEIFEALVHAGVDLRVTIVTPKGRRISARKVVDDSFKSWTTDETHQQLLARFPEE